MEENKLNEAPASATVKIKSSKGFEYLFTLREMSGTALLNKLEVVEENLIARGYTAVLQGFTRGATKPVEYVEDKVCPIDGKRLVKGTTKDGKAYEKCETQKYDFTTKQKSGCVYFKFT